MTHSSTLSLRSVFRANGRWLGPLLLLPCLFLALLVLPPPFGLGRDFGNDFGDHRIWWVQMDAFWLSHGLVPLWNPTDQFGVLHVGARGMGAFYPFRWWLYIPAIWTPQLNYAAQYVQIAVHMAWALVGIFVFLRRHTPATGAAAAFATLPFLLTQRFVDFVRYPQGIEAIAWLPWILVACLECSRDDLPPKIQLCWAWRLAAATALSFLAGYGHLTYIGGMLVGVILLGSIRSWRGLVLPSGAALLGLVVAAGSLYPAAMQTLRAAGRSGGDPDWANQFLPSSYLDMWLRPFAVEVHGNAFFPPIYLALAALGVALALGRNSRRLSLAMLGALVLIADLAQGSNGMLFTWLYENMPMYHAFRNHGRSFWPALIVVAYFSAYALAWIEQDQKRAVGLMLATLAATLVLGAFVLRAEGPLILPGGHVGYSPLASSWITLGGARWAYGTILTGEIIALGILLLGRWTPVRMMAGAALTAAFVLGFAQFSTWFVTERPPPTHISTREAYPNGLFQAYQANPGGILGIWGRNDPPLAQYKLYVDLQPYKNAVFPASRFLFIPENATTGTAEIRVCEFDANHFDFDLRCTSSGTLVYFANSSPFWHSTPRSCTWPQAKPLFTAFNVTAGTDHVQMSCTPPGVIFAGLLSLCGTTVLMTLALDRGWRSWTSRSLGVGGLCAVGFFLVGSLMRHPLDVQTLTGASKVNPFQWHGVPVNNQKGRRP